MFVLSRLLLSVVSVWWKYHLMMCYCTSLPSSLISDVMLASWNQSCREYLKHRNQQMLQVRASCSCSCSSSLLENQLLDIYQLITDELLSFLWVVGHSKLRLQLHYLHLLSAQKMDEQGISRQIWSEGRHLLLKAACLLAGCSLCLLSLIPY